MRGASTPDVPDAAAEDVYTSEIGRKDLSGRSGLTAHIFMSASYVESCSASQTTGCSTSVASPSVAIDSSESVNCTRVSDHGSE
jgi:hypothetical protein